MAFDFDSLDEMLDAYNGETWETALSEYPEFDIERDMNIGEDHEGNRIYSIEITIYDKNDG
jgi:hypothetical protein